MSRQRDRYMADIKSEKQQQGKVRAEQNEKRKEGRNDRASPV